LDLQIVDQAQGRARFDEECPLLVTAAKFGLPLGNIYKDCMMHHQEIPKSTTKSA
jgi:hypothetical protein